MIRALQVSEEWILSGDLGPLRHLFSSTESPADRRALQGNVLFVFPEVEDRAEHLLTIPGVLDWFQTLYTAVPHIPYFQVSALESGSLLSLGCCALPKDERYAAVVNGAIPLDDKTIAWIAGRMTACARYATQVGDDWERVVRQYLVPAGNIVEPMVDLVAAQLRIRDV